MELKRGRPRKYDYEELEKTSQVSGAKTIRGKQNVALAGQAYMTIVMVREDPNTSEEAKEAFQQLLDNMRPSVFAELGRFMEEEGEETEEGIIKFWQAVRFLQENPKISAKKAIRHLRRMRLGGGGDALTGLALHDALVRTINEYLERYPDFTQEQVETALEITLDQCRKMGDSEAASE